VAVAVAAVAVGVAAIVVVVAVVIVIVASSSWSPPPPREPATTDATTMSAFGLPVATTHRNPAGADPTNEAARSTAAISPVDRSLQHRRHLHDHLKWM
jgi:hypothetical protein